MGFRLEGLRAKRWGDAENSEGDIVEDEGALWAETARDGFGPKYRMERNGRDLRNKYEHTHTHTHREAKLTDKG